MVQVKRETSQKRHQIVKEHYEELLNMKLPHGLKPTYESILVQVSERTGYSIRYIEDIVR